MPSSIFKKTYTVQEYGFNTFLFISYSVYILAALGIASVSPKYIETLDYFVKLYIAFFLLIRFNIFAGKIQFTDLDRKIAFSAGFFLLTTMGVNHLLEVYLLNKVKETVQTVQTIPLPNIMTNNYK